MELKELMLVEVEHIFDDAHVLVDGEAIADREHVAQVLGLLTWLTRLSGLTAGGTLTLTASILAAGGLRGRLLLAGIGLGIAILAVA